MSEFIKVGNQVLPKTKGIDYDLEAGNIYELSIREGWAGIDIKFKINGEFNMPSNVYLTKKDEKFIDRVINSYNSSDTNTTGVLLVGDKGTGKTINAKLIAQKANLPIIIISERTELWLVKDFFKSFETPVCILFDEADKNFKTSQLLTFLDGLDKTCKKLVIFTANNEEDISDYLKNRCSRIRYYKKYSVQDNVEEYTRLICEDKNIENVDEVVSFISNNIEATSIDNIVSFIDEIIYTKDYNYTLNEVLEFMNINVNEVNYEENLEYDKDKLEDTKNKCVCESAA